MLDFSTLKTELASLADSDLKIRLNNICKKINDYPSIITRTNLIISVAAILEGLPYIISLHNDYSSVFTHA